ncbi:MAG: substrate-binding domain-containing protein [Bacillota bacterium]
MTAYKRVLRFINVHAVLILTCMVILSGLFLLWLQRDQIRTFASKPRYHFFFIAQNSVDPFWYEVKRGMEASAGDNNVVIEFVAPRFNSPEEEYKYMDIAVASRVDGIITHIPNGIEYTDIIDKAYDRGIPVITIENDASESKRYAFVGTNSFVLGKEAAKLLIEATGGKANIAIISNNELDQGSIEHNLKMNGFISTMKEYPDMKIVKSYTSKLGILSAEEITQTIIDSGDNINAIFTLSSADTLGCAQLIVDRNKVGSIVLVGYGSSEEIMRYIDKEIVYGTVISDPYKMGYESVKAMVDIKDGKSIPTFIDTKVKVITKESIEINSENENADKITD